MAAFRFPPAATTMAAIEQTSKAMEASHRKARKEALAKALGQKIARNTLGALGAFAAGLVGLAMESAWGVAPFCLAAALVVSSVRAAVRIDCLDDEIGA